MSSGIYIACKECSLIFLICRSCWRGQKYCSFDCKARGYKKVRSKAQKKYSKTANAKIYHRKRQNKYRQNKKVTDQTSKKLNPFVKESERKLTTNQRLLFGNTCFLCGKHCSKTYRDIYDFKLEKILTYRGKTT